MNLYKYVALIGRERERISMVWGDCRALLNWLEFDAHTLFWILNRTVVSLRSFFSIFPFVSVDSFPYLLPPFEVYSEKPHFLLRPLCYQICFALHQKSFRILCCQIIKKAYWKARSLEDATLKSKIFRYNHTTFIVIFVVEIQRF